MPNNLQDSMALQTKLGRRWHAVSVTEGEYDGLGNTPVVEMLDAIERTPSHFQSVPVTPHEAASIATAIRRIAGEEPEQIELQGQIIVRMSVNAARSVLGSEVSAPIGDQHMRF